MTQDVLHLGLGSLIDIDHFKFISKVTGGSVTTLPSLTISDGAPVRQACLLQSRPFLFNLKELENDDPDSVFSQRLSMYYSG